MLRQRPDEFSATRALARLLVRELRIRLPAPVLAILDRGGDDNSRRRIEGAERRAAGSPVFGGEPKSPSRTPLNKVNATTAAITISPMMSEYSTSVCADSELWSLVYI